MSLSAAVIDALVAAGASVEQLAAAIKADLAEAEAKISVRRQKDAERQARSRSNRKSRNVTVTPRDVCDPPNDIYSNPPEPCEANASPSPFAEKLVEAWNAGPAANGARRAVKLDASRKASLKARLRENTEDEILAAVANLAASRFHCGENDRNWRAGIGWFLEARNFLKAAEMGDALPGAVPAKPVVADQSAYLASLDAKPWSGASTRAEAKPRTGNTGPPRPIGELVQRIAGH